MGSLLLGGFMHLTKSSLFIMLGLILGGCTSIPNGDPVSLLSSNSPNSSAFVLGANRYSVAGGVDQNLAALDVYLNEEGIRSNVETGSPLGDEDRVLIISDFNTHSPKCTDPNECSDQQRHDDKRERRSSIMLLLESKKTECTLVSIRYLVMSRSRKKEKSWFVLPEDIAFESQRLIDMTGFLHGLTACQSRRENQWVG